MPASIRHIFECAIPDGPDTGIVRPSNWNDEHTVSGVAELHGWPLDEASDRLVTLAYDAGTRKVTITALSGATFDLYVRGEKITVASPHVSVAHDATAGGWFYYHDGAAWVWSQTPWDMRDVATTAYVYYSTVANEGVAYYELHGATRDTEWHWLEHHSRGTALISGGVLGDYTLATDTDVAVQFSVTETKIADEDIHRTLTALPDGGPYTIWRRSGTAGVWMWSSASLPFLYGTYPQRNYDAGGGTGWTMADISGLGLGTYLTSYVLAVPSLDSAQRYIVVPGQTQYSSLATAQAETIASLTLGDLPWPECVPIAQLVFQAKSTFGGTAKAQLAAVNRLIGNRAVITGAAAASNHNALSGLQGGTAGEYYHLTEAQFLAGGIAGPTGPTGPTGPAGADSIVPGPTGPTGPTFQFPVGYIYISVDSTNPATVLGYGTWATFAAGRVLVGVDTGDTDWDTVEETRGAKTVAAAGTISGVAVSDHASHTHSVTSNVAVGDHAAHTHSVTSNVAVADHAAGTTGQASAGATQRGTTTSTLTLATHTHSTPALTHTVTNNAVTSGNPSATLTHSVTNNAVTSGNESATLTHTVSNNGTFTGSATSVVQPSIAVFMFKRTA